MGQLDRGSCALIMLELILYSEAAEAGCNLKADL